MSFNLTPEGCAGRRKRLWQALPEPCEVLLATTPESLIYLANYSPSPFLFNAVEAATALVLWPDHSILIGDNLLQPFLEASCVDEVVCLDWYTGKKSAPPRLELLMRGIVEQIAMRPVRRLGVESLSFVSGPASRECNLDPLI